VPKEPIEAYSEEETAARRDAALLRALSTPHKKQSELKIGKRQKVSSPAQTASDASRQADAPASRVASNPKA
jgi:hypothetical protein